MQNSLNLHIDQDQKCKLNELVAWDTKEAHLIELLAEMSFTLLFINFIRVVHGPMGILKCNRSINDLNAERGEKRNDF